MLKSTNGQRTSQWATTIPPRKSCAHHHESYDRTQRRFRDHMKTARSACTQHKSPAATTSLLQHATRKTCFNLTRNIETRHQNSRFSAITLMQAKTRFDAGLCESAPPSVDSTIAQQKRELPRPLITPIVFWERTRSLTSSNSHCNNNFRQLGVPTMSWCIAVATLKFQTSTS